MADIAGAVAHIRSALRTLQYSYGDLNAGQVAGMENNLGAALEALGASPNTLKKWKTMREEERV